MLVRVQLHLINAEVWLGMVSKYPSSKVYTYIYLNSVCTYIPTLVVLVQAPPHIRCSTGPAALRPTLVLKLKSKILR